VPRAESSQASSSAETAPRALDFRILGSLEVWREGERLTPGRGRQSALLALLLLHRNQAVPSERLIEELWPAEPPRTAVTALQVYVGRLRKLLGRDRVLTQSRGYALQVDPGELDADRFEQLVRVGRPAEALQLWRGPALADFPYEGFTQNEIGRLTELRVLALEQALGAEIDAGRASEAISELEVLVAQNPYRERLRLLLMVALYRSGRQTEALDAYQAARRALVELGVEPSEELRDLHRRILAQDAGLAGPHAPAADHAVAARTDRRIVTILDCRLADATRLGDELDPEPFRDLLDRFADACSAAITRHIGTVADGSGQLVLGAFGTVRASEDDALRALRAAIEIHTALGPLELEASIGIATGEILAGGEVARVAGAVVSLAATLQATAEPGGTVFDEETYARCRDAVVAHAVEPRGEDRGEPVRAYALDTVIAGAAPVRRRFETPLVGRESELADGRYAFDTAVQQRTTTLFTILGAPGVGKTRLARELVATVASDARVLESRCVSYGEGITYWPLRDLILAAFGAENTLGEMTDALAGEPDGEATADRLASAIGLGDRPATRGEIFAATRRLLEVLAREGPLVLVFEDIHWAEATLLDLIEYLAANVRDAPVFLLCLARTELVEQRGDWSGGESSGGWLRLEPLSARESTALLGHLAPELDSELRGRIVSAAEGNPFFLEQTLALALEGAGDVDVPPSIQAVLAERLDQLGASERAVVEAAAVIGRDFSVESVEELLSPMSDVSAGRELASLARREIVRPHSSPHYADGYRFGHILVRESAYAAIPKRVDTPIGWPRVGTAVTR
jgi:DNA-binding SARP family transcriptional activator